MPPSRQLVLARFPVAARASTVLAIASLSIASFAIASTPTTMANPEVRHIFAADGRTLVDLLPRTVVVGDRAVDAQVDTGIDTPDDIPVAARDATRAGPAPPARTTWELQFQGSAVFTDLSMADATHGFASAELGKVYRTTDGQTWQQILNLGFPRYWYGVHAFDASTVLITGFNNSTGEGIARWSHDGGATWTGDLVIDPDDWLSNVQFADAQHGVVTEIAGGSTFVTTSGGGTAGDWTEVITDPSGGWQAGNFTFMPDLLYVYVTGISFCRSVNGGISYGCRPSIDPVFDGGVSFPDTTHGWTGGGQISTPVQGWVHRTTDAGQTWSGRILNPPYPIRSLLFLDASTGFVVGGNYFQAVGGIWSTTDGGDSFTLDVDTGVEMKGIDWARVTPDSVDVWCAGSASPGTGKIYRTRIFFPESSTAVHEVGTPPTAGALTPVRVRAAPNPAARAAVRFSITAATELRAARLALFDATGRRVDSIDLGTLPAGLTELVWDGSEARRDASLPTGVYFYQLVVEGRVAVTGKVITLE